MDPKRLTWRRQDGQAVVEMALILPVLLLLIVGILKFGFLYNNYITLTDAVRVGSRELALGRGATDPCTAAVRRAINNAASLNLTSSTNPAQTAAIGQVKITLTGTDSCGTVKSPTGTLATGFYNDGTSSLIQGNAVSVEATYPCDLVILGINFYPSCRLKAVATEAAE
jgi:Flp pilus assembly protein TadG